MSNAADVQALIEKLEAPRAKTRILGDSYIMDDAVMRAEAAAALRSLQSRITALEAERDAAVLAEREACAQIAEREGEVRGDGDGEIWIASKIADAIRARSNGAASPTPPQSETVTPHTASDAMRHLRNVLSILSDLHPDDQSQAFTDAVAFFNAANPTARISPVAGYSTRLVHATPIDTALAQTAHTASDDVRSVEDELSRTIGNALYTPETVLIEAGAECREDWVARAVLSIPPVRQLVEVLVRIVASVSTGPSGEVCQCCDFDDARAVIERFKQGDR